MTITRKIAVALTVIAMLVPTAAQAQSDGGKKKKKKERTEQTFPSRPARNDSPNRRQEAQNQQQEEQRRQQEEQRRQQENLRKQQEEQRRRNGPSGQINGHDYVDLGLPSGLKWATCNIGASKPTDYGNYYAWGETSPKSEYTEKNSRTYKKRTSKLEKNNVIYSSGNLTPNYDAAYVNWGGTWRMPSESEFEELIKKCTWKWIIKDEIIGYQITGPNGKSIFLPAAGWKSDLKSIIADGEDLDYWSSTIDITDKEYAMYLSADVKYKHIGGTRRYWGRPVRAVSR